MPPGKTLVTGCAGLIGHDLVPELIRIHGAENVIASDLRQPSGFGCEMAALDVTDAAALKKLVSDHNVTTIHHLAGLLSAGSEANPALGWKVNFEGLRTVLEAARESNLRVFWPSSIAAFGETTPKHDVPQRTVLEPSTIYGVAKVSGELMCQYYFQKYGVDVRSLRYPGILGWKGEPGDGTTEYAIHIFYAALRDGAYECFLGPDARLPMMFIDDTIRGTIELMDADPDRLTVRTSYNFTAASFTPAEIAAEIAKRMDFKITYNPDPVKQEIAESWPQTIDDSDAQHDWDWKPQFGLPEIVDTMLAKVGEKLSAD